MLTSRLHIQKFTTSQCILALVVLVVIAQGCSFTGNPISARAATREARQCLKKEFPHVQFDVREANYDYKRKSYRVHIYQSEEYLGQLEFMGGSINSDQVNRLREKLEHRSSTL